MENNSFKSSVFGGFNRQDVIEYIEKSAKESQEILDALEQEKKTLIEERDAAREENLGLKEQNDALTEENHRLQVELEEQCAQAQRCQELEKQLQQLSERVNVAEPLAQEYLQAKEHIASYEIEAGKRAAAMENQAKTKLSLLVNQTLSEYQGIYSALNNTVQYVSAQLHDVGVTLSQLPIAFNKTGAEMEDLKKSLSEE